MTYPPPHSSSDDCGFMCLGIPLILFFILPCLAFGHLSVRFLLPALTPNLEFHSLNSGSGGCRSQINHLMLFCGVWKGIPYMVISTLVPFISFQRREFYVKGMQNGKLGSILPQRAWHTVRYYKCQKCSYHPPWYISGACLH